MCLIMWHTLGVVQQTPTQALATLKLGQDVTEWALNERSADPQPSFQAIANRLRELTAVEVTDQTIRLWCNAALERAS